MPYVKVPEVDREIWVDLHEPIESGLPWFAEVGTEVKLTPEQFAAEMASPDGFIQTADVLSVSQPLRYGAVRMARSAMSYERARRKLIKGRTGRPRETTGFSKWEDFAIIVRYFESLGYKQPIRQVIDYWPDIQQSTGKKPRMARRQIELATQRVRGWLIGDLFTAADLARKRWGLPPIPTKRATPRR